MLKTAPEPPDMNPQSRMKRAEIKLKGEKQRGSLDDDISDAIRRPSLALVRKAG